MVQIGIPDGARPYLDGIVRYHFWILGAIVPLILVPVLGTATTALRGRIAVQQSRIDSKFSDLRGVAAQVPQPNENWSAAIDAETMRIDAETRAEWQRLWHSQRRLRAWPATLGGDFLQAVATLRPGAGLERPFLVRYQNMAPRLVRELPARMGVAEATAAKPDQQEDKDLAAAALPPLTWDFADQEAVFKSFNWPRVPGTTQVVMAQEELWVYGMFCDIIAAFTKGATGGHDSPLTVVERLAIGFPAIEEPPGGAGGKRLHVPERDPVAPGYEEQMVFEEPPPDVDMPEEPPATPQHPRFGESAPQQPTDDDYRSWVYVDFSGKGLTAARLAKAPPMVRLMPFVLRIVIDQRQLDRFLATLATWPIPIDVRQVRINHDEEQGGRDQTAGTRLRPYDVRVELRGTVGLATPPDQQPTSGPPGLEAAADEQAARPPAADRRLPRESDA